MSTGFLKVEGTKIVDGNGTPVILKGTASGGHLNMENFITGYPGHETEHKKVMLSKMGKEKFDFFFDKFYEYFWTEKDAIFFKEELKMNCLRIPFNYRHFIDDDGDMFKINPKGFKLLDATIDTCSKHGIYTILDLHATPGGQNQGWHSDSATHKSQFWDFKVFQDIVVNLWVEIAKYYKNNTWVAGYNPLNEPAVSDCQKLLDFYDRVEKEIRAVDPNHILYLDGNTYAQDMSEFKDPLPNCVYAIHDYSIFGFPNQQKKLYGGTEEEKEKIATQYKRKIEYCHKHQLPVWNGEFGPVYASKERGDEDPETINKARYEVLKDQLKVYKSGDPSGDGSPISWSIWLYKDIGYQGLAYVNPDSKFYQVLGDYLIKKKTLGLDKWGRDPAPEYEKYYDALVDHFKDVIPEKNQNALYPKVYNSKAYIIRVTREMLLSQYFQHVYADIFAELTLEEIDEFVGCFKIENMLQRKELNAILRDY